MRCLSLESVEKINAYIAYGLSYVPPNEDKPCAQCVRLEQVRDLCWQVSDERIEQEVGPPDEWQVWAVGK